MKFVQVFVLSILALSEAFVPLQMAPQPRSSLSGAAESLAGESPYSNVKGVIWDVDGTLADSWKLGYDATAVVLKNNGVPHITEEEYHQGTVYCTPERLARHTGLEPSDGDFDSVGQRLGDEFDGLYVDLVSMDTAGFYPGISSLLNALPKDVALGALTNACVAYAHAVLKTNCPVLSNGEVDDGAIYSRFGSIRGADDVPTPKPSPDGLFAVCRDLGLEPNECIYIGDSPSDGSAAKAAGMGAIGVLWGSHPEENLRKAPFDHLCSTVEELQALMPR